MSRLCGIVNLKGGVLDPAWLPFMLNGVVSSERIGSGRYRADGVDLCQLCVSSPLDTPRATQPLTAGDLVLIADARLDNRSELIRLLRPRARSRSPADADLILEAYGKWGQQCAEFLCGDFAFAVWNRRTQQLFLARDALGARGLYYHIDRERFVFASDIAGILSLPFVNARINETKVVNDLINAEDDGHTTFFQDVHACPAGHSLSVSATGVQTARYWCLDPNTEIRYTRDTDYVDHFLSLLTNALENRMAAAGDLGISLSGGCDSTLLAALATKLPDVSDRRPRLRSFSYVFNELTECDERRYIETVVDRCGIDAVFIPGDELWSFRNLSDYPVPRDTFCWDCFSQLPMTVARTAAETGCHVLLDGHFGDVLFSGGRYLVGDWLHAGRWGHAGRQLWAHRHDVDWHRDVLNHGLRPLIPAGWRKTYRRMRPRDLTELHPHVDRGRLADAERARVAQDHDARPCPPSRHHRLRALTDATWARRSSTPEVCLRLPVERRSPYFDRRIVEFAMALPGEQLARLGTDRWLQRRTLSELLPTEIAFRRTKTSYEALLARGLARESGGLRALMADPLVVRDGWIRKNWLVTELQTDGRYSGYGYPLATAVHLELWLRAVAEAQATSNWATPYRYVPG